MGVYAGAVAPEGMTFSVSRGRTSLDLSTVLVLRALITRPDQTQVTWSWEAEEFESQALGSIVVRHAFAEDGSDVPVAGLYQAKLSVEFPGGGVVRLPPTTFTVNPY